jgi:hypothetical protein
MVVWEDGDRYSVYLLYWYFTGTKVQKLTLRALSTARKAPARASRVALLVLYWYKSTKTDAARVVDSEKSASARVACGIEASYTARYEGSIKALLRLY